MRIIADLHIHSGYSRATSKDMTLESVAHWAGLKGINLVGTGDFTHPAHFSSIEEKLSPAGNGLFTLKNSKEASPVHFMLTAEVSNIWSQGGRLRKVHSLLLSPSLEAARKVNASLSRLGNIHSDGRPIFGFSLTDLLKIVLDSDPDSMLVPAHAWTPWFSIFGSRSGFDSIGECFGDYARHIHAIETGLSSNPQMNWRLSALDGVALISNSDAHSPSKLGREANVFDCRMDYGEVTGAIKERNREKFLFTVEFYPEEGKYHSDGHRGCGVSMSPAETVKAGKVCPRCSRPLTVGVLSRVEELADRPDGFVPPGAIPARQLVPLEEILAQTLGSGVKSGRVQKEYRRVVEEAGSEFSILLDMPLDELRAIAGERTAQAVVKVRSGDISITPGYDGEFGKIRIFSGECVREDTHEPAQIALF